MALTTLEQIQGMIRDLTQSPSEGQLTTDKINDLINTFYLYDMPEILRSFDLRTTLTFYTTPNVAVYDTVDTPTTAPLYNFRNRYINIYQPVYCAGYQIGYYQDRNSFNGVWPSVRSIQAFTETGDGVQTAFSGTLSGVPVLQNHVNFVSKDDDGEGIVLVDVPQNPTIGDLVIPDDPNTSYGTIEYLTGDYSFNFPTAPADGAQIFSETVFYTPGRPYGMLFYDNKFTLRPVPDKVYPVTLDVQMRPTEFLTTDPDEEPHMQQWSQYIAYGAAIKVLQFRRDEDGAQALMPEFRRQENMVNRKTTQQLAQQKPPTIFNQPVKYNYWGGYRTINN